MCTGGVPEDAGQLRSHVDLVKEDLGVQRVASDRIGILRLAKIEPDVTVNWCEQPLQRKSLRVR